MITLKNIGKRVIRQGNEVQILHNINLQFADTGLVVLKGGKESGKSSLLRVIGGIDEYTDGNIFVDGVDIGLLGSKELENYRTHYVGCVFGASDIVDELTLRDNIEIGSAFGRIKPKKAILEELFNNLRITSAINTLGKDCTPENKALTSVARLLVKSPKVLLVDSLDDTLQSDALLRVWRLLKEVSESHLVIIVSDSEPYINKFADRVVAIDNGTVVSDTLTQSNSVSVTPEKSMMDKSVFLKKHRVTLDATGMFFKSIFRSTRKSIITSMVWAVLVVICFTMFGTLCTFKTSQVIAKSSYDHNDNYIEFYQGKSNTDKKMLNYDSTSNQETVIEHMQELNYSYMCAMHEVDWETNISDEFVVTSLITNSQDIGVEEVNKFGQKILSGKYTGLGAIANDEAHSQNVVISDYMAECIIKYGINAGFAPGQNVTGKLRNIDLYDAITSGNITSVNFNMNGMRYNIIGIYKTDFDEYVNNDLTVKKGKEKIFEYNLKHVYSVIHVNTNFYTTNSRRSDGTLLINGLSVTNTKAELFNANDKVEVVNSNSNYFNEIANLFDESKVSSFESVFGSDASSTTKQIYVSSDIILTLVNQYKYNNSATDQEVEQVTFEQIRDKCTDARSLVNYAYDYLRIQISIGSFAEEYTIAGFIPDESIQKTIVVKSKLVTEGGRFRDERSAFEKIYIASNYKTNTVIMPVKIFSIGEIQNVIDTLIAEGEDFKVETLATESIYGISNTIEILRWIFVGLAILFVLLMLFTIHSFVRKTFLNNAKTIGMYRAIGCTKVNMNVNIALFTLMLYVSAVIVGVFFAWLLTMLSNVIMLWTYGHAVSIFTINMFLTLAFGVVVIIGCIATVPNTCKDFQNLQPYYIINYNAMQDAIKENVKSSQDNMEDKLDKDQDEDNS